MRRASAQRTGVARPKSPTGNRIFAALVATAAAAAAPATAQPLDEADVIRLAARAAPDVLRAAASARLAAASTVGAGAWPDPSLSLSREQIPGGGGSAETSVVASVPIDLGGGRAVERSLARAGAASARADQAIVRARATAVALLAFYEALAAEQRVHVAEVAVAQLADAARVLSSREDAGAAAGVDRARLELEAELGRSALAEARAERGAALLRLRALTGAGDGAEPRGGIEPPDPPPVETWLDRLRAHPAWPELDRRRAEADAAADAARRARWPTVVLEAGVRVDEEDRTRVGYVAGLSVELPLSARGRGATERASAAAGLARAARDALRLELELEVRASHARLVASRRELHRFREAVSPRVDVLERGAAAAYREGRRPLTERIDAQRAAAAVRSRQLALALAARRAEVELRAAVGEW